MNFVGLADISWYNFQVRGGSEKNVAGYKINTKNRDGKTSDDNFRSSF